MRLLYVHPTGVPSPAANAVQVAKMCQAFEFAGADVMLAVPRMGMTADQHFEKISELYGLSRETSFRVLPLPMLRMRGQVFVFAITAILSSLTFRPEIVYTRSPAVAIVAALLFRAKTVFELHDPVSERSERGFKRLQTLIKSKSLRKLVVTSRRLAADCVHHFPNSRNKILVAPNGADIVEGRDAIEQVSLVGGFKVGYVGQLYKGKGMEIISQLAKLCPDATFHVVGGTTEDVTYWKSKLFDCPNVIFHGYVPHAQTHAYIEAMDIVLAPYLRDVRGYGGENHNIADGMSPLKLFEYMAHGKAIVSSDLPPIREILSDGVNARLIAPESISGWVQALNEFKTDKMTRLEFGAKAKDDFLNKFSRNVRAQNIISEISSL